MCHEGVLDEDSEVTTNTFLLVFRMQNTGKNFAKFAEVVFIPYIFEN